MLRPRLPLQLGGLADVWVSRDGRRIVGLAPSGAVQQWELPTFRTATGSVLSLVQLLTGQHVDASDGIAPLEPSVFLDAPEEYRRAWLSWRGLGDDPAVPSSAEGEKEEGKKSAMFSRNELGFTRSFESKRRGLPDPRRTVNQDQKLLTGFLDVAHRVNARATFDTWSGSTFGLGTLKTPHMSQTVNDLRSTDHFRGDTPRRDNLTRR